jgi:hypothetical protein
VLDDMSYEPHLRCQNSCKLRTVVTVSRTFSGPQLMVSPRMANSVKSRKRTKYFRMSRLAKPQISNLLNQISHPRANSIDPYTAIQ